MDKSSLNNFFPQKVPGFSMKPKKYHTTNYGKCKCVKSHLPDPKSYYAKQFSGLNIHRNKPWTQVKCCFHDEQKPSLGINLISGGFNCFACGAKGGDIISFHQKRYKLSFKETIKILGVWYE